MVSVNALDTVNDGQFKIAKGCLKIIHRFDIGTITVDYVKIADALGVSQDQRQTIKPRVEKQGTVIQFIAPPVFRKANCQQFDFNGLKNQASALLLVYPDGFIEVEFEIIFPDNLTPKS